MRALNLLMLTLLLFGIISMVGCGGGGGGGSTPIIQPTPTPVGTTVNLTAFKGVFSGTAKGSEYNFELSGADQFGYSFVGYYLLVAYGTTNFEGQNVTRSSATIDLRHNPLWLVTYDEKYFQVTDGSIYKIINSSDVVSVPISQTSLPVAPRVGDSGVIGVFNNSNGTTKTITWMLNADVNGTSKLVLTSEVKMDSTVQDNEVVTYYLDASGNPTKISVILIDGIRIYNLSGNRI